MLLVTLQAVAYARLSKVDYNRMLLVTELLVYITRLTALSAAPPSVPRTASEDGKMDYLCHTNKQTNSPPFDSTATHAQPPASEAETPKRYERSTSALVSIVTYREEGRHTFRHGETMGKKRHSRSTENNARAGAVLREKVLTGRWGYKIQSIVRTDNLKIC